MTTTNTPLSVECPECAGQVSLTRRPLQGEVIRCPECAAELEVVNTDPLRVEPAPEIEEDWGE